MTARVVATLRLARRMIRRSPARSVLVALLVAIPVLAGTFAAVTIRTGRLSPAEAATRELGRADAVVAVTGYPRLDPTASFLGRSGAGDSIESLGPSGREAARRLTGTAWSAALPAGSRITPDRWTYGLGVSAGNRTAFAQGVVLDLADPLTEGTYRLEHGRAPRGAGQVALTDDLAGRLGVGLGDTVRLDRSRMDPARVTVTAVVSDPRSLSADQVVGSRAAVGGRGRGEWGVGNWLVDTPGPAPDLHDRLAARGVLYETRAQWTHPAPDLVGPGTTVDAQVLIVLGTVAGFGLLEIVLLAGAAFAVGARRQSHDLGLLVATGGDDRDVRRAVLAQGVLLGLAGAVVGVAGGVATVAALRPVLERLADRAFGGLDVRAVDLVAVAVLGVAAGFLAAVVPARAASRRDVIDMLRERFGAADARVRVPRWAALALVAGPAVLVVSAVMWHHRTGDFARSYVQVGSPAAVLRGLAVLLRENAWPAGLWAGAAIALAGAVRCCPAVVVGLARVARRLPVGPRLAVRDAARHRHRTAPAAAAVMTVIAGVVIVLFVVSSNDLRDKRNYEPGVPVGSMAVSADRPAELTAATQRVGAAVGPAATTVVGIATVHPRRYAPLTVADPTCVAPHGHLAACSNGPLGIVQPAAVGPLFGSLAAHARQVLDSGGAVAVNLPVAHLTRIHVIDTTRGPGRSRVATLPAWRPAGTVYDALPVALVTPATAAAHGWHSVPTVGLVTPAHLPSVGALDRLQHRLGDHVQVAAERGYQSRYPVALLALLGAAVLATVAGTSIAVALAMAESRADMATLAAVGASPGRRRVYAMGQAATVAGTGTAIGLVLGALVAVATLGGSALYPTSTPYRWIAGTVVGAPLLAVLVAGAFTRARVTLTRRLT